MSVLLLGLAGCAVEQFDITGTTESFPISSAAVGDDFEIFVYLPPEYSTNSNDYPLVVGLDGDAEFEPMAGIVSEQIKRGNIPPSIFIGIGYGSISANDVKRDRDYTPTNTSDGNDNTTGGAANFYAFIQNELMPKIALNYRVDTAFGATLMGHSYGGLFSLFAMFQNRSMNPFDKFIPVAASFWYDSGVIFELEEQYASTYTDFPAKIYTTMGTLEGAVMVASFEEMNAKLESRKYPDLKLRYEILEKYGHSRSDYVSYETGLEYVFNH